MELILEFAGRKFVLIEERRINTYFIIVFQFDNFSRFGDIIVFLILSFN